MNRKINLIALALGILFVSGCVRAVAHAESDAGMIREQLPTFSDARQDYLLWNRHSGPTGWQRERARELDALRGVGGAAR